MATNQVTARLCSADESVERMHCKISKRGYLGGHFSVECALAVFLKMRTTL